MQPIPRGKKELFLRRGVIDEIEEAIDQQYEISYEYDTYGPDLQMHAAVRERVQPFYLLPHRGRYLLIAWWQQHLLFDKLDHIKNVQVFRKDAVRPEAVKESDNTIDGRALAEGVTLPLTERTQIVEFLADERVLDDLIDRFGTELRIIPKESGLYLVRVNTNLLTAARFAIDYGQFVEVVFPQSVRSVVYHTLSAALRKYRKKK